MRGNNVLLPRTADTNMVFGKLDYQINAKNTLSASFNYMDWTSPNGIQTQAVLTNNNAFSNNADSTVRNRYGASRLDFIPSSTVVNEARFGWFKDRLYDPNNPASDPGSRRDHLVLASIARPSARPPITTA